MDKEILYSDIIIFDDNAVEMVIGNLNLESNMGKCKIELYTREGDCYPHFHIINPKNKICCPCIYMPYYFNHGYKNAILNNNQLIILNNYMMDKNSKYKDKTNWQVISDKWIEGHGIPYEFTSTQPDYTKMTNIR